MDTANQRNGFKVAFQGERGAFSEDAARRLLGREIETMPCRAFEEMFAAVAEGTADAAAAPIENSLAGSVHKNYDLLMEHDLTIIGETNLRIVHHLIGQPGASLADVRRVHSHPVALAQCEKFLRAHPRMEVAPAYDTAGSVKMVIETGSKEDAAIAGASAAEMYGAAIIVEGIEDNPKNFTRFLLLARPDRADSIRSGWQPSSGKLPACRTTQNQPASETGDESAAAPKQNKTSIVFRVANKPGGLFRALAAFALRDIDLTKIESRPIEGRPWEYSFYLDLIGDQRDPNVERALANLEELAESVRVLGSYARSEE